MILAINLTATLPCSAADEHPLSNFEIAIRPILAKYCYDCHGNGEKSGHVAFDELQSAASKPGVPGSPELWSKVLSNVRAGLMPAEGSPKLNPDELKTLERWIKFVALGIDPDNPDPGRVTIRRLNRNEYRRSIRELTDFPFKSDDELPPDDTGYGFDNNGDVLSISPLLMEKYMQAAEQIVAASVPSKPPVNADDRQAWKSYRRFFTKDEPPESADERRHYSREILERFAGRAFRRPVDDATVVRLQDLAESIYSQPGKRFEEGVALAMVAVLASPQFLFRVEQPEPQADGDKPTAFPLIDEYSLASRLSYFLWSTMPDDELLRLAERRELRMKLREQVLRMMKDERFGVFSRYFVGQWLQARDVEGTAIDHRAIAAREDEAARALLRKLHDFQRRNVDFKERQLVRNQLDRLNPPEFTRELREAMRLETEMAFSYVVDNDRSVLELIDADYTFVNDALAKHYGLPPVEGRAMRRVDLPANSPRGGVLTQGTMLVVTSNPTRTSPVKRGLFILDNLLGAPPPPPPANLPPLEASQDGHGGKELSMRELLAVHRSKPLCNSCHSRMDPLGMGLENFNAMGRWRDNDLDEPVDAAGELITGEHFSDIRELKKILVTGHRLEFYRTLTEKLLTFALGRGVTYLDTDTVDTIVEKLEQSGGRFSELLFGIIESVPFQKSRTVGKPNGR
ncbi:MAG: DUF1592 domain-containing protein [Pirellulales bacterium]|nr:DUF1592 domain-containing protein [Pirellulales bacterium]